MARGYAKWLRRQEGWVEPEVVHHLNDYLRGRLDPASWGPIEQGELDWIINAFGWSKTPQGSAFWSRVYSAERDQKLACEILRSWMYQLYP